MRRGGIWKYGINDVAGSGAALEVARARGAQLQLGDPAERLQGARRDVSAADAARELAAQRRASFARRPDRTGASELLQHRNLLRDELVSDLEVALGDRERVRRDEDAELEARVGDRRKHLRFDEFAHRFDELRCVRPIAHTRPPFTEATTLRAPPPRRAGRGLPARRCAPRARGAAAPASTPRSPSARCPGARSCAAPRSTTGGRSAGRSAPGTAPDLRCRPTTDVRCRSARREPAATPGPRADLPRARTPNPELPRGPHRSPSGCRSGSPHDTRRALRRAADRAGGARGPARWPDGAHPRRRAAPRGSPASAAMALRRWRQAGMAANERRERGCARAVPPSVLEARRAPRRA